MRIPRDRERRFVNWSRTVVTTPSAWREPASEDEVQELVRSAIRAGGRLRVVGAGHSWSAIAAPHDVAISLDRLSGIVALDRPRGLAVVRGGTRLGHLNAALAREGMALPIVGSIAQQSIAGAIATGTHGSSLVHGNLSSLVHGLRLVTGSGDVLDLDADDPRLDGGRVHLGALGVVVRVVMRVEPSFRLAETVEDVPIANVAGTLESIARSSEYAKVWWLSHTDHAQVYRYARTTDAESRRPSARRVRWFDESLMHRVVFPAVIAVQGRRPAWIPAINRVIARTFMHGRRVGASALMLSTPLPVLHRETEAALPMHQSPAAVERIVRLVKRENLRVNMPLELRFVRGDTGWMSPAHGADTCQIGAYMGGTSEVDAYFAGFWREMRALGARPHWGKELDHEREEIRAAYPCMDRFLELRAALDPDRRFASPFQDRVIGS